MTSLTIWCGIGALAYMESLDTMKNLIGSCCVSERQYVIDSLPNYTAYCCFPHITADHRPISRATVRQTASACPLRFIESGLLLMLLSNHVFAYKWVQWLPCLAFQPFGSCLKITQNHWIQRWWQTIVAYVKPNYTERSNLYIGYRCAVGMEDLTPVSSLSTIVLTKTVFKVQRV